MNECRVDICHRAIVAQIKIDDAALSPAHAPLLYAESVLSRVRLYFRRSDAKCEWESIVGTPIINNGL